MTAIYLWDDYRGTGGTYAQRLDTTGRQLWVTTDAVVSFSRPSNVVTDEAGGLIAIVGGQNFAIRAQQVSKFGQLGQVITAIKGQPDPYIPLQAILYQNYPNPFNPVTTIRFAIPFRDGRVGTSRQGGTVSLHVFDVLGRLVATLVDSWMPPGVHTVTFDGSGLAGGVYLYRLTTPEDVLTRKLLILK